MSTRDRDSYLHRMGNDALRNALDALEYVPMWKSEADQHGVGSPQGKSFSYQAGDALSPLTQLISRGVRTQSQWDRYKAKDPELAAALENLSRVSNNVYEKAILPKDPGSGDWFDDLERAAEALGSVLGKARKDWIIGTRREFNKFFNRSLDHPSRLEKLRKDGVIEMEKVGRLFKIRHSIDSEHEKIKAELEANRRN